MNTGKINEDIVKAIYNGERHVCGYREKDGSYFVTINGQFGYWLLKEQILFNTDKIQKLDKKPFNMKDFLSDEHEIYPTETYKKCNGKFIQKFRNKWPGIEKWEWITWINSEFLKPISKDFGVHFYQRFYEGKPSGTQPIMAIQEFNIKGSDKAIKRPLMLFMPYRIFEE